MENQHSELASSESTEDVNLTVEQAIANLEDEDNLSSRYYAAWWLGRFRVQEPKAVNALLNALEDEKAISPDGSYPLKRNAARALGKLQDSRAVDPLIRCLDCSDYYVRKAAAEALEMLEDTRSIPPLKKLLDGGIEAAKLVPGKPHLTQPYEAVIEALGTLGATDCIPLIKPFLEHFVEKIQYGAARAMYQLTRSPIYGDRLIKALQNEDLQLRRSAKLLKKSGGTRRKLGDKDENKVSSSPRLSLA